MKKFASMFLTLLLALSCTFALAACGDPCKDGHTGGTATCTQKAVCEVCKKEYGELLAHTGGTATCVKKATCSACNQEYGELGDHDFSHAENRILTWLGPGENIPYETICAVCGNLSTAEMSLGNYRTLESLMNPDDHPNAIKSFYKVIYDYQLNAEGVAFSNMQVGKRLEIGTSENARTCTIDNSKGNPADIKGEITVVKGNLILKGNVKMSGKIIVKSGATLTIEDGAEVANSGEITIEQGGILVNNGNVTGTDIVNNNN